MKQILQPTAALTLSLFAAAAQAQDDSTLSTVVVTGNRGAEQRTVTSSPVPIDVVSARQLLYTGKPGLMEALSAVIPSLTLPEKTGWDASGIARAPNLRGLSAAEVLVLVNGKRRHTSATLNINGTGVTRENAFKWFRGPYTDSSVTVKNSTVLAENILALIRQARG